MSTFKQWVTKTKLTGDKIVDDFIRDARADRELPSVTTKEELTDYLTYSFACDAAIDAAEAAWERYCREQSS